MSYNYTKIFNCEGNMKNKLIIIVDLGSILCAVYSILALMGIINSSTIGEGIVLAVLLICVYTRWKLIKK